MKAILFALIASLAITPALATTPLDGNWTNPHRTMTVHIGRCGRTQCGRVISASSGAREAAAEAGTPTLIGTVVISDLDQTGPDSWAARIFVPDRNVRSEGDISLSGPNEISVRGCIAGGFICKEQTWTRVAVPKHRRR